MSAFIEDSSLVAECLAGDEGAWRRLRDSHWNKLRSILCARGASVADAEEILSDLWPELGGFVPGHMSLLSRYQATGPLHSWLATVAIHRLANRRRRVTADTVSISQLGGEVALEDANAPDADRSTLAESMLEALRRAWAEVSPTARLMLLLVYVHGLTQREIATLWGWNESKVSRFLDSAMKQISRKSVGILTRENSGISIEWEDFLQLSDHSPDLFLWRGGSSAP